MDIKRRFSTASLTQFFIRFSGVWADPSGTAILGQPLTEPEQAPELYPLTKISLISRDHMDLVSDIKLIRTDTTL